MLIVHGGTFHADDVMCAALMRRIDPDIEIERVFEVPDKDNMIVADIGLGKYDHHQQDCRLRESGEKYAACGLLLEDIWKDIFPDESSYREFEKTFIIPIELADNGVCSNALAEAVDGFLPPWDSDEDLDSAFEKAVDFMSVTLNNERGCPDLTENIARRFENRFPTPDDYERFCNTFVSDDLMCAMMKRSQNPEEFFAGICLREIEQAQSRARAEEIVKEALENSENGVVVLPRYCPWETVLCPSSALSVVYPSNRGEYNIQVVPVAEGSFEAKESLPAEWLDNKPEGCSFVHSARFLAAFDTEEHAITAAYTAYREEPEFEL